MIEDLTGSQWAGVSDDILWSRLYSVNGVFHKQLPTLFKFVVVNHFCTSHIERCWNPERNDPGFQFPMSIWFILQVCRRRHVLLYQAQERAVDNSVHSDVFLKATVLKFLYETKLQWMSIYSFNIARQITADTWIRRYVRYQIVENGSLRLARPP